MYSRMSRITCSKCDHLQTQTAAHKRLSTYENHHPLRAVLKGVFVTLHRGSESLTLTAFLGEWCLLSGGKSSCMSLQRLVVPWQGQNFSQYRRKTLHWHLLTPVHFCKNTTDKCRRQCCRSLTFQVLEFPFQPFPQLHLLQQLLLQFF